MAKLDNIDQLVIETVFHDRGAVQGLSKVQNQQTQIIKKNKEIAKSGFALGKAFRLIGTYLGIRELVRYSDEWTNIKSTLSLVTKTEKERLEVQRQLFSLSQRTRQDMSSTVDLYRRISTSTEQLGLSESKRLEIVEAINKALIIGGGTTAGNQAALVQLGQGLASGQLRGEELNSILEQAPRLAQMIAEGMGLRVGQLRATAQKGELTPEKVLGAISNQLKVIDSEFKKMKPTVGQAFIVLKNSLGDLVNKMNEVTGISTGLATAVTKIAENLEVAIKVLLPLLLLRFKFVRVAMMNTGVAVRFFEMRVKKLGMSLKAGSVGAWAMAKAFIKLELIFLAFEEILKFFKGESNIFAQITGFFMFLEDFFRVGIEGFVNKIKAIANIFKQFGFEVENIFKNIFKRIFGKDPVEQKPQMAGRYLLNSARLPSVQNLSNGSSNMNATYNNYITVNEATKGMSYVNNILEGQTRLAIDGLGY